MIYYILKEDATIEFDGDTLDLPAGFRLKHGPGVNGMAGNINVIRVLTISRREYYLNIDNFYIIDSFNPEHAELFNHVSGYASIRTILSRDGVLISVSVDERLLQEIINNLDLTEEAIAIEKAQLEELQSIFKYYPISQGLNKGFLINNYIVSYDPFFNLEGKAIKMVFKYTPLLSVKRPSRLFDPTVINSQCKFLIKNYIDSAKIFKFTTLKKSLVGSILDGCDIDLNTIVKSKADKKFGTIKIILPDGGKTRFLLSDVEIIYPNLKSFNPPKSRIIKEGSLVKVADNRRLGIPKNQQVLVKTIKSVGNQKYVVLDYNGKNIYANYKSLKVC